VLLYPKSTVFILLYHSQNTRTSIFTFEKKTPLPFSGAALSSAAVSLPAVLACGREEVGKKRTDFRFIGSFISLPSTDS
jgi:hypothetical protein